MESVFSFVNRFKYLAMFGILVLCGLGLPIPEEVTLLASGVAGGWEDARYLPACLACTAGILLGDSVIFWVGRGYGRRLFASRFGRWLLPKRRQARVRRAFFKHGKKTVFFARFVAGLRIGVYAYAGQHGMRWGRFLFLDFLGCVVSVPTSIWVGKFAAENFADRDRAHKYAQELLSKGHTWLYCVIGFLVVYAVAHYLWNRWRDRRVAKQEREAQLRRAASQQGPDYSG